jgi:hypothetical protein|tara:strand:- start:437 stop:643 length:207 start_codon:yes stop_codon:yes gene_type:complete
MQREKKKRKEGKSRPVIKSWPDYSGYLSNFSKDLQYAIKNRLLKKINDENAEELLFYGKRDNDKDGSS